MEKIWSTPKDVEKVYGISRNTLAILRHQGRGPKYYKPAGRVLYKNSEVDDWIEHSARKTQDSIEMEKIANG